AHQTGPDGERARVEPLRDQPVAQQAGGLVLLAGQLGVGVDAPPHAAQLAAVLGEPGVQVGAGHRGEAATSPTRPAEAAPRSPSAVSATSWSTTSCSEPPASTRRRWRRYGGPSRQTAPTSASSVAQRRRLATGASRSS